MKPIHHPPRWADRFLEWFCSDELLEEIQGDLQEAYHAHVQELGKSKADLAYVIHVFRFFKPYAFEKYSRAKQFLPMFNNYFKIAIRNILNRKGFTSLNMVGLTFGISAIMLIGLFLQNEWTYDHSAPDHQRVFRLVNNYRAQAYTCMFFKDYYDSSPETQMQLINYLRDYDEVQAACHFVPSESATGDRDQFFVEIDGKSLVANNVLYTNTGMAFQEIFPQTFLMGSPENAFSNFNTAVLTEKLARQWFGKNWKEQELIGKELRIRSELYTLGGVIKDLPDNVHYQFDWILYQKQIPSWAAYTYLKLKPNTSPETVVDRFNKEVDRVYPGYSEDELQKGIDYVALTDIHFTGGTLYELKPVANKAYLYTFALVGLVILLIILTNYTNLSIAMYADRQKELGIRKVMGAQSRDISFQLLAEAILLALIAMPICWAVMYQILPYFGNVMEVSFDRKLMFNGFTLVTLFLLCLLTGLLSGLYPAIAYGNRPMLHLFGSTMGKLIGNRALSLRNVLITVQFVMVVGLLSMTFFIHQQMDFIRNKDLGYEKEGVVYFGIDGAEKYAKLKTALLSIPEIESVGANGLPGEDMYSQLTYKMSNTESSLSDGTEQFLDFGSLQTLGIPCEACQQLENGKKEVFVINRTAAQKLAKTKGVSVEALIGETLITEPEWENEEFGFGIPHVIDGIIEDYNFFSLKYPNQSLLLTVRSEPSWANVMLVRANTKDWPGTIQKIKTAYAGVEEVLPIDLHFLEDRIDQLYADEQRSGKLMSGLSLVAIILALMGLAGMVSYIAFSRQKEIGIRKVLGASVKDILISFNKEFVILMSVATLIAAPLAIFFTYKWLNSFAFSIQPSIWVVFLSGISALLLVVAMVSFQARHTAYQQPVDVLKAN